MKRSYSTDLSDAEWKCLQPHVPPPNKRGRPRAHAAREILDAVFFYVLKRAVVPGGSCPESSRPGGDRLSTGGSVGGARMEPSSSSTPGHANECASVLGRDPLPS